MHFLKIIEMVDKMNRIDLKGESSYFHTLDMVVWAKSKLNNVSYAVQLIKSPIGSK